VYPLTGIGKLCGLFGVTRQAYYQANWREHKIRDERELVLEQVKHIRRELPKVGTNKLYFLLAAFFKEKNIKMGRDKLYTLLRENNLLIKRTKRRSITTLSNHAFYKYPNLIKEFTPTKPNQLWVSDMTYIRLPHKFAYLSLITDAYSKRIVGWSLQETMHSKGPVAALKMALSKYTEADQQLIHHSDRGLQCRPDVESSSGLPAVMSI
jgi:putative transposase